MAEQHDDPFWTELAEEARAAIDEENEARVAETTSDDREDPLAAALFAPMDEEFRGSLVRSIRRQRAEETGRDAARGHEGASRNPVPSGRLPEPVPGSEGMSEAGPSSGLLRRLFGADSGWGPLLGTAALVVISAGLLFVLRPSLPPSSPSPLPEPPLPAFELALLGTAELRSTDPGQEPRFRDGQLFEFRLRPATAVQGPTAFALFVRSETGEVRRWSEAEAAAERSEDGTVLARGLRWPWGTGTWTVVFVVDRQDPGPFDPAWPATDPAGVTDSTGAEGPRVLSRTVRVEPMDGP